MTFREYYTSTGEPENDRMVNMLENVCKAGKKEPLRIEGEVNEVNQKEIERVKNAMDSIDFEMLRELLDDMARRSGLSGEALNFLGKDRIILSTEQLNENVIRKGQYGLFENVIRIFPQGIVLALRDNIASELVKKMENSPNKTASMSLKEINITEERLKLKVLKSVIHEQVHALSFTKIVTKYTEGSLRRFIRIRGKNNFEGFYSVLSGYNKIFFDEDLEGMPSPNKDFIAFDEGVTEKIAFEILNKYLSVEGSDMPAAQVNELEENTKKETTYGLCLDLVDDVIRRVAKQSGFSEDSVWQAIKRSKLEGVNFEDTEIGAFFDESTYKGFFEKLRKLQTSDSKDIEHVQTCLRELDDDYVPKK